MGKGLMAMISLVAAAALAGCGAASSTTGAPSPAAEEAGSGEKLNVFTTIYPLEYVTKRIGKEHIEVINMVPPGVEPHDFEPTAKDMVALTEADLFVYNGSGLELWVEKALRNLNTHHTQVVNTTEGLNLLSAKGHADSHTDGHADEHADSHADEHAEEQAADAHEHGHDHGDTDPHVWLDPTLLKAQAEKIKDVLAEKDPAHAAAYEENFQQLAVDLDQLDQEFQDMVAQAAKKEFMVSHSAFSYLANRYGLEQVAISGINPADEPSPSELKELVEHVKEYEISYVLFEPLVSPKVAEVVAKEAGVKTATLNPLEGLTQEDVQAGKDYLSIMRENLETLRKALNE